MVPVVAHLNSRFRITFLILIPATLGIGSLLLWLWRRSFVKKIDSQGLYLWSGRIVPWENVQSLSARKASGERAGEVLRLEVDFEGGRAVVAPLWLENGAEVAAALRSKLRRSRSSDTAMRVHYVQKLR